MQKLDESVVLRVIREEWESRKAALKEEMNTVYKPAGKGATPKHALSPGLKVKHKKTGMLCTIDAVGPTGVIMCKPEGAKFIVTSDSLEKDYELD